MGLMFSEGTFSPQPATPSFQRPCAPKGSGPLFEVRIVAKQGRPCFAAFIITGRGEKYKGLNPWKSVSSTATKVAWLSRAKAQNR